MKTYALIDHGSVFEIIPPVVYDDEDPEWQEGDASRIGQEIPIRLRRHPDMVANMVDVTYEDPMPGQNWTYSDGVFAPPVPYQPTPEETLAENIRSRDAYLSQATLAIAPLQDAVDLDEATQAETDQLKKWKQYRVAVNRIDLTQASPVWPLQPD
jgi:hypothetical protein